MVENQAVLADFGLVHVPDGDGLTPPDRVAGSMGYIADEVMMGTDTPDWPAADTFALAKVLWRLLTPGAQFPPGGQLRADGGSGTLALSLTLPGADSLDRVLARATAPLAARLTMRELADELVGWLGLPAPAALAPEAEAALAAARDALAPQRDARAIAQERTRASRAAADALRASTSSVLEAVRALDPVGAATGSVAAQALQHALLAPVETGQPNWDQTTIHAVRLVHMDGWREQALLVAFCLQTSPEGDARVTGALLSGDETTNDNTFHSLPTMVSKIGVALDAAIDEVASAAAAALPKVLEDWTKRIQRG